jgi:hypothetical protein
MKKVVRLTESDLIRVIEKVIREQEKQPSVNTLLNKLDDVPTEVPGWLNNFLKMKKPEFNKFVSLYKTNRVRTPTPIFETLKSMGCKDFKTCLNELEKYKHQLRSSYRRLNQDVDSDIENRLNFLYEVLEYTTKIKQPPLK